MIRIVLALAALTLLAGCGDETGPGVATPAPANGIGGDYVADGLPAPFGDGDVLRMTLADGTVSFQATCNSMSGDATWDDGVLRVSQVGGTEMGCPGKGFEQDDWLIGFFTGEPTIRVDGDDVALTRGGDEIWFVPGTGQPEPAVELEGTTWTLTGIEETDGDSVGMMGVPQDVDASLTIEDGRMQVRTGCNRGSADVTVLDTTLEPGPLALTKMACSGAAGEVERGVVAVLDGSPLDWSISGTQLRLANGDRALVYDAG